MASDDTHTFSVVRVDPITGATTSISSGGLLENTQGVAIDGAGQIIAANPTAGLIRVDPSTGTQTLISSGGLLAAPFGVAVEPTGQILVADPGSNGIVRVDPVTGSQTSISADGLLHGPTDLVLDASGRIVIDDTSALGGSQVVRIDPATGAQTLISVDVYGERTGIEIDDAGSIIVTNQSAQLTVDDPPAVALVGSTFVAGDKVMNRGNLAAGSSSTRYFLSLDQIRSSGDRPLTGTRAVPGLAPGSVSQDTKTVTVPSVPAGNYYVIACADDTARIAESDEGNNCVASARRVKVTGADLAVTAVSSPPATALPGATLSVTDTVRNQGSVAAAASTTRYYLSRDTVRDTGDVRLGGSRAVPGLAASSTSTGTVTVTVPLTTPAGSVYLLACADDANVVTETSETDNCRASEGRVNILVSG